MRSDICGHVLTIGLILSLAPGSIPGGVAHSGNIISQGMQQTLLLALEQHPPQRMIEIDPFIPESMRKELKIIFKKIYDRNH